MIVGFNSDLFLRRPMTGIANYCFELISAQLALDPSIAYLGFTGIGWKPVDGNALARVAAAHHKNDGEQARALSAFERFARDGIDLMANAAARFHVTRTLYRAARRRRFSSSFESIGNKVELFHAFNFQPHADLNVTVLPVIYDLSFLRFPEAHPKERLKALESLPTTIMKAPRIQTISRFTKNEIISVYGYPEERIFVAPPAAAAKFRPLGHDITGRDLAAFDLKIGKYFLAVGTLEPRKNLKTLIAAYQRLTAAEQALCPLVIVGAKGWGQLDLPMRTEELIQAGSLRFVGSVPDAALRSLYEGATMLLYPSIYEGFGMPVVEAMACGTAVAHSADTSMDEISADLAARVSATDVEAWSDVMRRAVGEIGTPHDDLRQARQIQSSTFDWRHSAAVVLDQYRQLGRRS